MWRFLVWSQSSACFSFLVNSSRFLDTTTNGECDGWGDHWKQWSHSKMESSPPTWFLDVPKPRARDGVLRALELAASWAFVDWFADATRNVLVSTLVPEHNSFGVDLHHDLSVPTLLYFFTVPYVELFCNVSSYFSRMGWFLWNTPRFLRLVSIAKRFWPTTARPTRNCHC